MTPGQLLHDAIATIYYLLMLGSGPLRRLFTCIVLAYPLAALHRRLPSTTTRHVFSAAAGFVLYGYYSWNGIYHALGVALASYYIVKFRIGLHYYPLLVFLLAFGHLGMCFAYRQVFQRMEGFEFLASQMFLSRKCISFAFNVYDGTENSKASPSERARGVTCIPSLLEFFSFIFFFGGVLIGPLFEVREYLEFTDRSLFKSVDSASSKDMDATSVAELPDSSQPTLRCLKTVMLIFVSMLLFQGFQASLVEPYLSKTKDSPLLAGYIIWAVSMSARFRNYQIWIITEGACVLAGLGYKGKDSTTGQITWDRVSNVKLSSAQFPLNARDFLSSWNITIARWLRRYVYNRLLSLSWPSWIAGLVTLIISAITHGFAVCTFLSFIMAWLVVEAAKFPHRWIWPRVEALPETSATRKMYLWAGWLATEATLTTAWFPFLNQQNLTALMEWSRVYVGLCVGCVLIILLDAVARVAFDGKRRQALAAKALKVE